MIKSLLVMIGCVVWGFCMGSIIKATMADPTDWSNVLLYNVVAVPIGIILWRVHIKQLYIDIRDLFRK